MTPNKEHHSTDNLEKLMPDRARNQFYQDVKTGQADVKDFERYIYGGTYQNKNITDARDRGEAESRKLVSKMDANARDHIETLKADSRRLWFMIYNGFEQNSLFI